jgi:ubiquinone/menaquinone biosynthesis C-methylase UbiE
MLVPPSTYPAALAFDRLASDYDSIFTFSAIGKSQRDAVRKQLLSVFAPGSHILELNCGTGQDALFMTRAGMRVTACDASARMVEQARARMAVEQPEADAEFLTLPTEEIASLPRTLCFDGVFSNFAGLNCVRDLGSAMRQAAPRLQPGAPILLCMASRCCLWEILYFLLRGNRAKALRRCGGSSEARLGELRFPVFYPTLSQLRRILAPEYRIVSIAGIGITVPPSYLEPWMARHPRLLRRLEALDAKVRTWPGLRTIGDHLLLHLERVGPC